MTSRGKMLQRLGAESYVNQNANDPNNIPSDENVQQKLNLENVDKSTMKLNNALDLPDARTRDENEDTRCKSSENKTSDSSSSSSNSSSGKSSSSTSSSSSGSDSDESSSSEDCDDLYDQTYKPSQEDLNVNSDGDIEIGEDSGNALSTFCPNSTSTSLSSNSNTIQDISTFISPKKKSQKNAK